MNRRKFLKSIGKICAVLPFVGSSSAVGDTGVSESKSGCSWKGKLKCGGQNGTLCPRCIYGVKRSGTRPATKEEIEFEIEFLFRDEAAARRYSVSHIYNGDGLDEFDRQAQAECLRIEAAQKAANPPIVINPNGDIVWKFYINNKEIDSSRAVDENGCLSFPFQGAKKGNLCTAKSPKVLV